MLRVRHAVHQGLNIHDLKEPVETGNHALGTGSRAAFSNKRPSVLSNETASTSTALSAVSAWWQWGLVRP